MLLDADLDIRFQSSKKDPCLYSKTEKNGRATYFVLYVDDLLIIGESKKPTKQVSIEISQHFEIKDLGDVSHYLGIKIERKEDGSFLLKNHQAAERSRIFGTETGCDAYGDQILVSITGRFSKIGRQQIIQRGHGIRAIYCHCF